MNKQYLIDLGERVGTTAAFTFASYVSFIDLEGTWKSAAVAAGAAVLSLLKGVLAQYVGDESPGLK